MQHSADGLFKLILYCTLLRRRKILKARETIWIYLILLLLFFFSSALKVCIKTSHPNSCIANGMIFLILWLCRFHKSLWLLEWINCHSLSPLPSGWRSLCKVCILGLCTSHLWLGNVAPGQTCKIDGANSASGSFRNHCKFSHPL